MNISIPLEHGFNLINISGFLLGLLMFGGGLFGIVRILFPPLTPEEKARKQAHNEEQARRKDILKEASRIHSEVVRNLTGLGLAKLEKSQGFIKRYDKVKFEAVVCTDDAVYLKLNARRLPWKVGLADINQPEVSQNLSFALQREVSFEFEQPSYGFWVVVGLASGAAGIPKSFPYYSPNSTKNARELTPASKPLAIPIGVTHSRKFVYDTIPNMIHGLIAGASGQGKSVFLNQMICHLITHNSPGKLKLALVDLKGGLEFQIYEKVPHLLNPIICEREDVPPILKEFQTEKIRRTRLIKSKGFKDIAGWNANQPNRLPVWILIFDEIQNLMLDKKIKSKVDELMKDLAEQGRAVGLHVFLCTQYPDKEVVSTSIKANCTTKICFKSNETGSMVVLGNQSASKLPNSGRGIYRGNGRQDIEVQTPYLGRFSGGELDKKAEAAMINEAINTAIEKWSKPEGDTPEELGRKIFGVMWREYGGNCSIRLINDVIEGVNEQIIRGLLEENDFNYTTKEPVIDLADDTQLILATVPARGGSRRQLIQVDSAQLPDSPEESIALFKGVNVNDESEGSAEELEESAEFIDI